MTLLSSLNLVTRNIIPFSILASFVLMIVLVYFSWKNIKGVFKIGKKMWILLIIVFLGALLIRMIVPPHQHIMYIDEPWYMESAKSMLETEHQGYYPKSIGWPFILRIAFSTFGLSNWVAINTSVFLGALTVFLVFFTALMITGRKNFALISALLFSLFPAHVRWSATAEANVASLFFIVLSVFFSFSYYQSKDYKLLWLSLVSIAFASQFRAENYILPLLFLIGCIIYNKEVFRRLDLKFVLPWAVMLLLSFANFIQVADFYSAEGWIERETEGLQKGSNWGISNLMDNSLNYGIYVFNSEFQPLLFSILLFSGFFYMFFKQRKDWVFLMSWLCILWFAYFFSWFQTLGGGTYVLAKIRFFMSFYPITVIFSCYGILLLKDILARLIKSSLAQKYALNLIVIILVIAFVPYTIKASIWFDNPGHLLETKIPELAEKDLPSSCLIISNWPTVLKSTTYLNVIDTEEFLASKSNQEEIFQNYDCVLFFEDLTCSLWDVDKKKCERIKSEFLIEPFKSYKEGSEEYGFYRILNIK